MVKLASLHGVGTQLPHTTELLSCLDSAEACWTTQEVPASTHSDTFDVNAVTAAGRHMHYTPECRQCTCVVTISGVTAY